MNWVFDTYSDVYKAAMMQTNSAEHHVATAKKGRHGKHITFFGLFGRH